MDQKAFFNNEIEGVRRGGENLEGIGTGGFRDHWEQRGDV